MCVADGINLKLVYKQEVYIVNILKSGEKYVPQRARRIRNQQASKKTGVVLNLTDCPDCHSLLAQGICVNRECISNKKATEPQL